MMIYMCFSKTFPSYYTGSTAASFHVFVSCVCVISFYPDSTVIGIWVDFIVLLLFYKCVIRDNKLVWIWIWMSSMLRLFLKFSVQICTFGIVYVRASTHTVLHYGDVIMGVLASQITSLTILYSDQRKQSSVSLAFVWGIHRLPVNSPHKWPVTRKMFPFDDVIMAWSRTLVYRYAPGNQVANAMMTWRRPHVRDLRQHWFS